MVNGAEYCQKTQKGAGDQVFKTRPVRGARDITVVGALHFLQLGYKHYMYLLDIQEAISHARWDATCVRFLLVAGRGSHRFWARTAHTVHFVWRKWFFLF